MDAIVIVPACCVAAVAVVACILTLRAPRRSRALEAPLQASLLRQKEALQQAERKSLNKTIAFASARNDIRPALAAITGPRPGRSRLPQMMHNLGQMDVCTKKLLGILNSILDTSKVESGRMRLEAVEFNPADVFEESMDMVNVVGVSKGLEVVWDPCDLSFLNCGNVIGDWRRFKQILNKVLRNSVKFTQEGHACYEKLARCSFEICFSKSDPQFLLILQDKEISRSSAFFQLHPK